MSGPAVTVMTVAYDGAGLHGFARQDGLQTVQGRLEEALQTVLHRVVTTVGAGRTDAGVHALGQVVSFESAPEDPDPQALLRSVGALAGRGIVVTAVRQAARGFSARHSAVAREYRYRIVPGPVAPVFLRDVSWWRKGTLDLPAMRAGAACLLGEHDFRSFCVAVSAEGKRTVRDIELIAIEPEVELGEHCVVIRVVGRSFLHSMVRIVAGSLVEVGLGRRPPAWIGEALAARDRAAAGPTAPAQGLTLWHVAYPDELCL
jgi:tRNA pseudouridine38-40 synthase